MYGYLAEGHPGTGSLVSADAVTSALKRYQTYAGLKASGIVDKETAAKFREPRCGMSDQKTLGREKRYVHQGSKWMKNVSRLIICYYCAAMALLLFFLGGGGGLFGCCSLYA